MENIIIRNVKKEDLWAVSSIAVERWKSAYRGILYSETETQKGGKKYIEVGYKYNLSEL